MHTVAIIITWSPGREDPIFPQIGHKSFLTLPNPAPGGLKVSLKTATCALQHTCPHRPSFCTQLLDSSNPHPQLIRCEHLSSLNCKHTAISDSASEVGVCRIKSLISFVTFTHHHSHLLHHEVRMHSASRQRSPLSTVLSPTPAVPSQASIHT